MMGKPAGVFFCDRRSAGFGRSVEGFDRDRVGDQGRTNTVIATLPVGVEPSAVAISTTGPEAGNTSVANVGSNTVSVIS